MNTHDVDDDLAVSLLFEMVQSCNPPIADDEEKIEISIELFPSLDIHDIDAAAKFLYRQITFLLFFPFFLLFLHEKKKQRHNKTEKKLSITMQSNEHPKVNAFICWFADSINDSN